jgi:proteasome assembly chaperone (PAC2) family protein
VGQQFIQACIGLGGFQAGKAVAVQEIVAVALEHDLILRDLNRPDVPFRGQDPEFREFEQAVAFGG